MTPEGKVKAKVKALLAKHGAYWLMPVQNGMGSPALDFHGCHQGRAFFIETKAGDKQPTPRQVVTIASVEKAGGKAFVVNEVSGFDELRCWLEEKAA